MITAHENAHPAMKEVAARANAAGLGVTKLAREAGVAHGNLSELFNARKKEPGLDLLDKLAGGLNCRRAELLGDAGIGITVPWERLMEVDNPRRGMDDTELEDLAGSIAARGVLQPLLVRKAGGGFYAIIAGHRRFRAIKMLGDSKFPVPVIVRDDDGADRLLNALAENMQRADMHPLDEAEAFRDLNTAYGMATDDIAGHVQRSRRHVQKRIQIACGLSEDAKQGFRENRFTLAVAEALSEAGEDIQEKALDRMLGDDIHRTEDDVRRLITELGGFYAIIAATPAAGTTGNPDSEPAPDPDTEHEGLETWPTPDENGTFNDCPEAVDFPLNSDCMANCDLSIQYIQISDEEWLSGYRLHWDADNFAYRHLTTENPVWGAKTDAMDAAWRDVAKTATRALTMYGDSPTITRAAFDVINLCEGALGEPVELPDGIERPADQEPEPEPEPKPDTNPEPVDSALPANTPPKETWNDDGAWDCPHCGEENIPPTFTIGGEDFPTPKQALCRNCDRYAVIKPDVSYKATPC